MPGEEILAENCRSLMKTITSVFKGIYIGKE